MVTDLLIDCKNPEAFDRTIQGLGSAALIQRDGNQYQQEDGYYVMRVFGDTGFIKFAITNQGYGQVIRETQTFID